MYRIVTCNFENVYLLQAHRYYAEFPKRSARHKSTTLFVPASNPKRLRCQRPVSLKEELMDQVRRCHQANPPSDLHA